MKIKTTKANRKQQKQKINIIANPGFEPRSLAWKARIITTGVLCIKDSLQIYRIFVESSVHRMGDQQC